MSQPRDYQDPELIPNDAVAGPQDALGIQNIPYLFLSCLAHRRNRATEEDLNARYKENADTPDLGRAQLSKLERRFEGHFPIKPDLTYLDLGCGGGELAVALAERGVREVTGVDFLPRHIELAKARAALSVAGEQVNFLCRDLREWVPQKKFDVLLSIDVLEHIDDPGTFLKKIADFVTPDGIAVLAFGPLFHSPFGDHMWDFFRVQIPWRGLLFSESVMLRLRRECFRPTDPATRYQDIAGGLNLMRYSEFLDHVAAAGWRFDYLAVNTFLPRRVRALVDALTPSRFVRDYFAHNVYAVLRRGA
jgi:SAM-dependent methyltransferase